MALVEAERIPEIHILVVEDSATQADLLSHVLEENGCGVSIARNGREALEAIRARRPTLVVSDILMPEMDGFELCRAIKSEDSLAEIPVVLLTSLEDPQDIMRGLEAGSDYYLTKPVDTKSLLTTVEEVVRDLDCADGPRPRQRFRLRIGGEDHSITASSEQILRLFGCTYENTLRQNRELERMQQQLEAFNETLEKRVVERTAALEAEVRERTRAEKTLRAHSVKLERLNRELNEFAYVASHDLQEPLRMVTSYVQLLERRYKGKLDSEAEEFIGFAVDGTQRMKALIEGLLDYSRLQRRDQPLEPTDSEAVVDDVLASLQVAIEESGALVTRDQLPVVVGDGVQLTQLFQNLIGNAIKFSGGKTPHIHIGIEHRDDELVFSVRDEGIGIDPAFSDRIFVIFQRLHTRDEYAGTGIGLAVCKKIVERHGGRIWVESDAGSGSTFFFTLTAA